MTYAPEDNLQKGELTNFNEVTKDPKRTYTANNNTEEVITEWRVKKLKEKITAIDTPEFTDEGLQIKFTIENGVVYVLLLKFEYGIGVQHMVPHST